ncbi:MAG: GatB/YqeY domain-containing protein [Planctomycetota bacterium]|jgi:uncharacterized protein YqeY
MLFDDIKARMIKAMKEKDTATRDILRLAMGEIQTVENREGKTPDNAQQVKIVRKIIKSNEETIGLSKDEDARARLTQENETLASLLPQTLNVDQVVEALTGVVEDIRAANNDGQATGVAMKTLKASGAAVDGGTVAQAVKQIRG